MLLQVCEQFPGPLHDEDDLLKTSKGDGSGNFDKIIFADTNKMDGYKSVVTIDFDCDIDPKLVDKPPYDPYMYDKTTKQYIHVDTLVKPSTLDAMGSSPDIADIDTSLVLVIGDSGWAWPKDHEQIWKKYTKFDDWVYSGFKSYTNWYEL